MLNHDLVLVPAVRDLAVGFGSATGNGRTSNRKIAESMPARPRGWIASQCWGGFGCGVSPRCHRQRVFGVRPALIEIGGGDVAVMHGYWFKASQLFAVGSYRAGVASGSGPVDDVAVFLLHAVFC